MNDPRQTPFEELDSVIEERMAHEAEIADRERMLHGFDEPDNDSYLNDEGWDQSYVEPDIDSRDEHDWSL